MLRYISHKLVFTLALFGLVCSLPVPDANSEPSPLADSKEVPSTPDDVVEAYNQILEVLENHFPELSALTTNNSKSSQTEDSFEREIRRFQRVGRRKRDAVDDGKLSDILARLTAEERKRELSQHSFGPADGQQVKRGESSASASGYPAPRISAPTADHKGQTSDTLGQLVQQIALLTDKLDKLSDNINAKESSTPLPLISTPMAPSTSAPSSEGMNEKLDDNSQNLGHDKMLEELSQQLLKDHSTSSTTSPEVVALQFASQQDVEKLTHLFYDSIQVNKIAYQRLSSQLQDIESKLTQ